MKNNQPFKYSGLWFRLLMFEYIRVLVGIKYEPGNMGSFGFAYGFNREFATVEPAIIYQFKINYTYQF